MKVAQFMLAASALAVSGTAHAQSTNNTSDVSQTGTNNKLIVDNARPGNDQNRSVAVQNGRDNTATVLQIGDLNFSQVRQIGDRDVILHTEEGSSHGAESFQSGSDDYSAIRQRGSFNSSSVDQQGNRNGSIIVQGIDATASANFTFAQAFDPNVGMTRVGNENRATVSQIGSDFMSTIRQRSASNSAVAASNNSASVQQRGQGNSSTIVQESRGNSATVYQFEGGNTQSVQNVSTIFQTNPAATVTVNPLSNNRANVSVAGQTNSSVVTQAGMNNNAEVTQGLGRALSTRIDQTGSGEANLARVAQYGESSSAIVAQNSIAARADVWQQAGPQSGRSANNSVEIQQGTGTSGSDAFSAAFFGNIAPAGAVTRNLVANVTQGNNPGSASWNIAQVRQDGTDLTAAVTQNGSGTPSLANLVRVAQQGGSAGANNATAIQRAGVGPSGTGDPASGRSGDEFYFAGGSRSAEIAILQSGSANSATVEQRGLGQFGRIEQGPGQGNLASILQDIGATNATAVIRQTGNNNSYDVVQTAAGQYVVVSQTGNNNLVTTRVERP